MIGLPQVNIFVGNKILLFKTSMYNSSKVNKIQKL